MATFPSFARIVAAGYAEETSFGVVRSEMDGAVAKQRPRYSLPLVMRDVSAVTETFADLAAWKLWIKTDINGGSSWFSWLDPLDSQTKQARIVSGKVKTTPLGGHVFQHSFQLETLG